MCKASKRKDISFSAIHVLILNYDVISRQIDVIKETRWLVMLTKPQVRPEMSQEM